MKINGLFGVKTVEEAQKKLANGAQIQALDEKSHTALYDCDNPEVAQFLIDHGIDVNSCPEQGDTALLHNAKKHNLAMCEVLLKNGADPHLEAWGHDFDIETPFGYALQWPDMTKLFLKYGANPNKAKEYKITDAEVLSILGKHNLNTNTYKDGETALFHCDNINVAERLIQMGTDPKKLDRYGRTALFDCRDLEIAQLLVDHGVDPNLKDKDGATAFYYYHDARIANYLIDKGLDVNNTTTVKGITPLFVCHDKDKDVMERLIKLGADVNAKNDFGMTPIFFHGSPYHLDTLECLISNGADVNVKNDLGQTPLFYAYDIEPAKCLIDNGADVNVVDANGRTALFYCEQPHGRSAIKFINLLIEHNADLNIVDKFGRNVLFYVKDKDVVSFLVKNGVDPTVVDNDGKTCSWNVKQIKNKNTIKIQGEFKSESYYSEFEEEFQKRYFSGRL